MGQPSNVLLDFYKRFYDKFQLLRKTVSEIKKCLQEDYQPATEIDMHKPRAIEEGVEILNKKCKESFGEGYSAFDLIGEVYGVEIKELKDRTEYKKGKLVKLYSDFHGRSWSEEELMKLDMYERAELFKSYNKLYGDLWREKKLIELDEYEQTGLFTLYKDHYHSFREMKPSNLILTILASQSDVLEDLSNEVE